MSRKREAPPKPEELIQKLEDKFNEFKTLCETNNENLGKSIEELMSEIKTMQDKQEENAKDFESKLESQNIKQMEDLDNLRLQTSKYI